MLTPLLTGHDHFGEDLGRGGHLIRDHISGGGHPHALAWEWAAYVSGSIRVSHREARQAGSLIPTQPR
jgi:hypothetical protein